jgi:coenzyme PQQ synthesis protein D (PqqD)
MPLSFAEPILQKLFPRKFVPKITRHEILAAVPVRNSLIEWETNDENEVVLKIPRREDRSGRLLQRFFVAPPFKQVVLDELGSDVWHLCTGENNVDAIVKTLARKYKLGRREVELSLANYLRTLAQRGYIGLVKQSAVSDQPSAGEVRRRRPQNGVGVSAQPKLNADR